MGTSWGGPKVKRFICDFCETFAPRPALQDHARCVPRGGPGEAHNPMPPREQTGKGCPRRNQRSKRRQCGARTAPDYSVLSRACHNTSGLSIMIPFPKKKGTGTDPPQKRWCDSQKEDIADPWA
ncbi:hypothetical protein TNIN_426131 [Trichonephila inaurata madagascariensis]|uniref:Uncharacterized protein n=1 Tax=Trichonephila inaurata madagascariensis TaxID=2747483 RepID=A0A8X6M7I3_9ARAC|nr:hypothetical protein TNIN_426131 [Trichonephila inaurata madagascariensis]